jgi:hypothetical protein
MGSLAESADWAALDPDFAIGKRAIVANDSTRAIKMPALRDDRNADRMTEIRILLTKIRNVVRLSGLFGNVRSWIRRAAVEQTDVPSLSSYQRDK